MKAGDVAYVPHDLNRGQLWEFGIAEYHGRGRKASDAWRNVMTTGNVLAPSRPARPREAPSTVRLFGFG